MLIRHDPQMSRGRLLMPVPKRQWMPSSLALPKDQLGNDTFRTRFRLRARTHDGRTIWQGWFEDRDDADAFLFALVAGQLSYEPALWRMPNPEWHPGISIDYVYELATVVLLTATTNTTYTSPADWNNADNSIECIGGAGSGGGSVNLHACGGGGGSYSKITNFSFATPGTTTATYKCGTAGSQGSSTTSAAGGAGTPTYFNASADPGVGTDNSKCSAAAGQGGAAGSGSRLGGAGGVTTASWGQTKYAGGRGGNMSGASGTGGSGGGGAAGPAGIGGNGVDSASTGTNVTTAGGSANLGTTAGGAAAAVGNNGTEWTTAGAGSGAGGYTTSAAGAGGNYGGAGGGGNRGTGTGTGGAGKQGLVVVSYTVAAATASLIFNPFFNQHILVR